MKAISKSGFSKVVKVSEGIVVGRKGLSQLEWYLAWRQGNPSSSTFSRAEISESESASSVKQESACCRERGVCPGAGARTSRTPGALLCMRNSALAAHVDQGEGGTVSAQGSSLLGGERERRSGVIAAR